MSNKIPKEGNSKSLIFGGVTAFMAAISMLIFSIFTAHKLIFPVAPTSAETSYAASSEVGLNVKESIKIAVDKSSLALEDSSGNTQIAPEASGTLITGDVNVAVTTNAYGGYRLGIYTADSTTNMTHSNTSVSSAINSISTATGYDATNGLATLPGNTWGFRKYTSDWSNWYGVGSSSSNMAIVDTKDVANSTYCDNLSQPVNESGCTVGSYDTYKIGFGANLTSSLPAGNYTNNIIFSAVTNEAMTFLTFSPNVPASVTVTGSMAPKTILKGSTTTLPNDTTFRREGLGVKGWALTSGATEVSTITQPDLDNPGSDPEHPNTTTVSLIPGATVDVDSLISAAGIPSSTTGPIPLYAVWDNAYNINYVVNNPEGTTVTGTMNPSNAILGLNTTIETNNYEIDNYTLKGWAFTADATDPASISEAGAKDLISGATFTTQQLITAASSAGQSVSTSTAGTVTLYAVWEENAVYFQTFNSCATIPEGETGTLVDSRDNQEYTVYHIPSNAVYPDTSTVANVAGKCIMTKDLNLGAVASVEGSASTIVANGAMTLSPEDSNFTTPTGSGESITVPTTSVSITNGTGNWTTTNSYSNKKYTTSGTGDYANRGYYSWGAAMTVCPKGWRLPTQDEYNNNDSNWNASTTGISKLVNNNISAIQSSPWLFVLGGQYSGSFSSAGSNGFYWSSTQYSSTYSYYLRLHSSNGLIRNFGNKYFGFSVRCIAEAVDGTMQNFDTSSLALGETANLIDERDNHTYKVKKLPDGKVWMINNLTLTATDLITEGKALTSANTNIPSSDTNSYYITPKNARYTSAGSFNNSAVASASASVDFGTSYPNYIQIGYRDKNTTDNNTGSPVPEDTAYYNFYTATLGYSYYGDGKTSGSSTMDICPKGWRLPKVSKGSSNTVASSEFTNLTKAYNSSASWSDSNTSTNYYTSDTTIRQNMVKGDASSLDPELDTNGSVGFTYAGNYNSNTALEYVGEAGLYWASSVYSSYSGYRLLFNTGNVYPQANDNKNYGCAVRCVSN